MESDPFQALVEEGRFSDAVCAYSEEVGEKRDLVRLWFTAVEAE